MSQITPCLWRKELEGGGGNIMPEGYEQADPKEKAGIAPIVLFSVSPKDLNFKYMCTSPKFLAEIVGSPVPPVCPQNRWGLSEKTCDLSPNFVLLDSIE